MESLGKEFQVLVSSRKQTFGDEFLEPGLKTIRALLKQANPECALLFGEFLVCVFSFFYFYFLCRFPLSHYLSRLYLHRFEFCLL